MKIGHYMVRMWENGGVARYLQRVSRAQRSAGHRVHFLDSSTDFADCADPEERPQIVAPADLARSARTLGLDVLHLHISVEISPAEAPPLVRTLHGHTAYCPSGLRYLNRQERVCERRFSIAGCVLGHYLDRCGSRHPGRLIEHIQDTRRETRRLPEIDSIAISEYIRNQMIDNGYDVSRVHVVHNPAPMPRPIHEPPRAGIPRFVFLGRIVRAKGIVWLLQAMAQVKTPIALDVAGDGPDRAVMEALVVSLGLQDSVTFHGWIDEQAIDALVAGARAVVFPPVWPEPAGLACMDGSARGRAVIASRSGGLPEYAIDGQNALVVPVNDTAALAQALTTLAEDWSLAAALGQTGHAMAAGPYSLDRHLQALERIYQEAVRSGVGT